MTETQSLDLTGIIDRVETTRRKKSTTSYSVDSGGNLLITVKVSRPPAPKPVEPHFYNLHETAPWSEGEEVLAATDDELVAEHARVKAIKKPALERKKRGMTDEEQAAVDEANETIKEEQSDWQRLQRWGDQVNNYYGARVRFREESARYGRQIRQFAATAALGIALEGEAVAISLTPDSEAVEQMFPALTSLGSAIDGQAEALPLSD